MTPQDRRGKHIFERGQPSLGKTQRFSLLFPVQRETGIAHQAGGRELWRLAAIKNGFCNIWGEERKPHNTRKIGTLYLFTSGDFPKARRRRPGNRRRASNF
jgi:hypothetical protein